MNIFVCRVHNNARLPSYAHAGEFGDLAADLYAVEAAELRAGETALIRTGLQFGFPSTHGALIEDRSGLAVRGVTTLAGVIDPGYRGELKVILTNLGTKDVTIAAGDRIAQMRIVQRIQAEFVETDSLEDSARGGKGFGSTGR